MREGSSCKTLTSFRQENRGLVYDHHIVKEKVKAEGWEIRSHSDNIGYKKYRRISFQEDERFLWDLYISAYIFDKDTGHQNDKFK